MERPKPSGSPLPEHFYQALAQEAIMGIVAFDAATAHCLFMNSLAREILEMPSELDEPSELKLSQLFVAEAKGGVRPFSNEILQREGLTQDVLVSKFNGMTFIANVGVKFIRGGGDSPVLLLMFQDITFQKKLQRELTHKQEEIHNAYKELLEQNRQLRELDLAKDRFIALISHELRTPLSAIVATAEVLQLGLHESEAQKDEFIKTIHEESLHLMDLVNDVLDFAKIRAGKMEFFIERLDIRAVIEKIVDGYVSMAEQAEIAIETSLVEAEAWCWVDLMRIREVLGNVISNAIKYNRKGGRVSVSVASSEDGFLRVTVADTGQGIPSEKIPNVFNEFETVGSVSRHHKGTGLGMPISKRLIEAMGGRLSLESEIGVGTRFYIDIPIERVCSEEMYRSRPDAWGDLAA